jgi:hypothetical protein
MNVKNRRALDDAQLADMVERALATAPPLTDAQLDRIAAILRGGRSPLPPPPIDREKARREAAAAQLRTERATYAKRVADIAGECGICGVPDRGHWNLPFGPLAHRWEAQSAEVIAQRLAALPTPTATEESL